MAKNSRYKYSQSERESLKVQKMQENDLNNLASETYSQTSELAEIRKRVETLCKELDVTPIEKATEADLSNASLNISRDEIPTWEELVQRAEYEIEEDIAFEDLLSKEEFQYCIDDVQRINEEFSRKTSIWNKRDLAFLAIATGLQTARWIILQLLMGDLGAENRGPRESDKDGDKRKKKENNDYNKRHNDRENKKSDKDFPTWKDIIFGQYKRDDGKGKSSGNCPYDAQNDGPIGFNDGGRGNHRVHTLGHDPLLGWIFGTANIMTCSISLTKKFNFANHRVLYPYGRFGERYSYFEMFNDVFQSTKEDKYRLAAALFAQGAHLRSDKYTSAGLPIPLIEVFSEELAGKLYSEQYDQLCLMKDLKKVGAQAGLSILINMIIGFVHKMFYDAEKDGPDKNLYEVRTRKILCVSNALASGGNIMYCAFTEDWKKLDIGGILVTLYRLFSDVRFITRIKDEFIQKELDKTIERELAEIEAEFI